MRLVLWLTLGIGTLAASACCRSSMETVEPGERFVQEGMASWYGADYAGRKTASGEIFDPNAMTAAHPHLQFGFQLRVTYLKTGQSVIVRINDRGPYDRGRIIDLSEAAASAIGLRTDGVGRVRIETAPERP